LCSKSAIRSSNCSMVTGPRLDAPSLVDRRTAALPARSSSAARLLAPIACRNSSRFVVAVSSPDDCASWLAPPYSVAGTVGGAVGVPAYAAGGLSLASVVAGRAGWLLGLVVPS
jgi:hypothetical protein